MLTIVTYNVGGGADTRKSADLDQLDAAGADVIALQECSDRGRMLTRWLEGHPGWRGYLGDGSDGAAATPILWRTVLGRPRCHTSVAVPRRYVGPRGAGPGTVKRKVTNRIRIRVGRTRVHVLNAHLLPSATRRNLPRGETRRRLAHYRDHIAAILAVVARRHGVVFVTGDFNAEPGWRLLKPMRRAGLRQDVTDPTHGRRVIDLVWHRCGAGVRVTSARVLRLTSDHEAAMVTYDWAPR